MKKLIITGIVGQDPKTITGNGYEFVTFSVGVNSGTKDKPATDWFNINCNDHTGKYASSYIRKGTKVLVEGSPSVRTYTNKENKTVATMNCKAIAIEILSRKEDNQQATTSDGTYVLPDDDDMSIKSDDVPF